MSEASSANASLEVTTAAPVAPKSEKVKMEDDDGENVPITSPASNKRKQDARSEETPDAKRSKPADGDVKAEALTVKSEVKKEVKAKKDDNSDSDSDSSSSDSDAESKPIGQMFAATKKKQIPKKPSAVKSESAAPKKAASKKKVESSSSDSSSDSDSDSSSSSSSSDSSDDEKPKKKRAKKVFFFAIVLAESFSATVSPPFHVCLRFGDN